ncbi:methyltransferase domain-containing protein [Polynucleobacter difficilis]|jgi:SAM-dependent methyltransferase|uniref:methyltransferase domain-containing protein n=1 Tax=Polynucleobacter difficilis TaxID=556054 RepID=UPI00131F27D8|nr:methyltransferase domain-containing protein [Polynucleobacter difficilis]
MNKNENIKKIYFGNLFPSEPQYQSNEFYGLALHPKFEKDIQHNLNSRLPFEDNSLEKIQSQDVIEHIPYDNNIAILDDVYRALKPGGIFRLSAPDYCCPLLKMRSVYDCYGNLLADLGMGASVSSSCNSIVLITQPMNGDGHIWYPTHEKLLALILTSKIRMCQSIVFHHYWRSDGTFTANSFDDLGMPVLRAPPHDSRANGKPISIIVDFIK